MVITVLCCGLQSYLWELVSVHADVLAHPADPDQPCRPDLPLGEGRAKFPLDGPPHRRRLCVQLVGVGEQLVVDDLFLRSVAELLGPDMVGNGVMSGDPWLLVITGVTRVQANS